MFHVKHNYSLAINFNPRIDPINKLKKIALNKVIGSLKKSVPIKAVPKAPIPVHTA